MTVREHWSIRAQTPLHLAAGRAPSASMETLTYIPGASLRGAVATAFLAAQDADTPAFRRLTEETCFGHAYPTLESGAGSGPIPLSSVTCRRAPGFRADGGHGVHDLLLAAEAALLAQAEDPPVSAPPHVAGSVVCAICAEDRQRQPGDGTVPWPGWYGWDSETPRQACVSLGLQIEGRAGGVPAQHRDLTMHQTLLAGQHFAAMATFPDEETAELARHLLAQQGNRLWVGAGRSRGLGELRVDLQAPPLEPATMPARQAMLTERLAQLCVRAGATPPDDQTYVSLTLQAAALVADPFGRWQRACSADLLSDWTGLPASALELRQSFQDAAWRAGWNAALGLPKPDALALAAGSCWLFRISGVAQDDLLGALERLEDRGIGERRQEGFGVVRVCEPLHWQAQELGWERTA